MSSSLHGISHKVSLLLDAIERVNSNISGQGRTEIFRRVSRASRQSFRYVFLMHIGTTQVFEICYFQGTRHILWCFYAIHTTYSKTSTGLISFVRTIQTGVTKNIIWRSGEATNRPRCDHFHRRLREEHARKYFDNDSFKQGGNSFYNRGV